MYSIFDIFFTKRERDVGTVDSFSYMRIYGYVTCGVPLDPYKTFKDIEVTSSK